MTLTATHEQRLIQAKRVDHTNPFRVIQQDLPVSLHSVVHGMPITIELIGDIVHRPAVHANLARHPPARPVRQRQPRRSNRRHVQRPRVHCTRRRVATPPVLAPQQPRPAAEHRQINQQHQIAVLHLRRCTTPQTRRPRTTRLDHNRHPTALILHAEHVHIWQTNKQLTHARTIRLHRGTPIRLA